MQYLRKGRCFANIWEHVDKYVTHSRIKMEIFRVTLFKFLIKMEISNLSISNKNVDISFTLLFIQSINDLF